MRRTQSIRFRLALAFGLQLLIVAAVGLFGLVRFGDFDRESEEIRDRWLKSTRYLGDLNNYTSDFRSAESVLLLSRNEVEADSARSEIASIEKEISAAQQGYERIHHDLQEVHIYEEFRLEWADYRRIMSPLLAARIGQEQQGAIDLFLTASGKSFAVVSATLEKLTQQNNKSAEEASKRANRAVENARTSMVVVITLGSLMVLAILVYVMRNVTKPLLELAEIMRLLAESRIDLEIRGVERADELGEMARAVGVFRGHAIELRLSQQGLANQAAMLKEKLAEERRLNESQANFISMASHEFRTPMNVIDGHAQRLINAPDPLARDWVLERARKIRLGVKRMSFMINGLLEASKLMEGNPALYYHPAEFDVRSMLHQLCALHREIAPNAMIIEYLPEGPVALHGDKNLLFQAFGNLIGNAVKYSTQGKEISVRARIRGDWLEVSVSDSGIGIPAKDIPNLFTKYYRASNASGIVGTGIGLYLVKVVADLHEGSIHVSSEEGKGSSFDVAIPIKGAPSEKLRPGLAHSALSSADADHRR